MLGKLHLGLKFMLERISKEPLTASDFYKIIDSVLANIADQNENSVKNSFTELTEQLKVVDPEFWASNLSEKIIEAKRVGAISQIQFRKLNFIISNAERR